MRGWGGDHVLLVALSATKEKEREEDEVERKDIFVPSGSLNTKPPTLLLLLL